MVKVKKVREDCDTSQSTTGVSKQRKSTPEVSKQSRSTTGIVNKVSQQQV